MFPVIKPPVTYLLHRYPVTLTPSTFLLALSSSLSARPEVLWTFSASSCPRAFAFVLPEPSSCWYLYSVRPPLFQISTHGSSYQRGLSASLMKRNVPSATTVPPQWPSPCYIFHHSIYYHLACYISHLLILIIINPLPSMKCQLHESQNASWSTALSEPISGTWWVLSTYVPNE